MDNESQMLDHNNDSLYSHSLNDTTYIRSYGATLTVKTPVMAGPPQVASAVLAVLKINSMIPFPNGYSSCFLKYYRHSAWRNNYEKVTKELSAQRKVKSESIAFW